MSHDVDAIVVGSGPSGVSVAQPMLEAGMRVTLLDGGRQADAAPPPGAYHDLRRQDAEQWRTFLGGDLEALRPAGPPSPKFDAPGSRFAFAGGAEAERVEGRGFAALVSHARGGFSNIWGAGVSLYGDEELSEFPLDPADLAPSYERVARRIGVSGFAADDLDSGRDGTMPSLEPLRLSENARRLFERYERRRDAVQRLGVRVGRPRTAVLSAPRDGRNACGYCDMCVWGCREQAIYSAMHDVDPLKRHAGFDYRPGTVVESLQPMEGGFRLVVRREGEAAGSLTAPRVLLAAGALVTTRLVLEMQGRFDEELPVLGAPGFGFALLLPERIGAAVSTRDFSMGQLSFGAAGDRQQTADAAYGSLFSASGLPGALVIDRMPLSRPGAVRLFRWLQPALLLGNCFLPGRYGNDRARLERDGGGEGRLVVTGGVSEEFTRRYAALRTQLTRAFRRMGAIAIPSSFSPLGPGEAIRYAGTLPMRRVPGPGEVDSRGELFGSPGLHVVDLSIFPAMSAKHHTLTMMAIADRIGRSIVERRRSGSP